MERDPNKTGWQRLLLCSPLLWLLLQVVVSGTVLQLSGRLEPHVRPDTRSYRLASRVETLERALQQHRTMGYPLLMRGMRNFTLDLAPLPRVHAILYFAAVAVLWFAVRAWNGSGWLALAATTPLVSAPMLGVVDRIQPDFVAAALCLVAVALLLRLVLQPRSWWLWSLLTCTVFVTYQFRPSYLFLVPLVPFLGWVLRCCAEGVPRWSQARWAAGLALATAVPLLLFSGLRKNVVGDFGLVSFTGFNLIGVTASLLDEGMVDSLPEDAQEVARRILWQRGEWHWAPMKLSDDTRIFQEQHNTNTWRISINPARRVERRRARQVRRAGEKRRFLDIEVNATLLTLSKEVIRQRPRLYLKWVRDTFLVGVGKMMRYPWVLWPLVGLAVTLPIAWLRNRAASILDLRLLGLVLLGGTFTWVHLLLVVAVSNVHYRYLVATALLLPSVLCVMLFSLWQGILSRPEATP